MEINPFIQLIRPVAQAPASAEIRNWQVGQLLTAVTTSSPKQGQVSLQIGSQTLTAQIQFNASLGQLLKLEVVKLGDQPLLRLTEPPLPPANKTVVNAIRDALPKQNSHTSLLANLSALANNNTRTSLPSNITHVIQLLFKSIPTAQKASTGKGVQQAVQNSGLFLEAKLGTQANTGKTVNISHDFKAGLLKLQQALRQLNETGQNISKKTDAGDSKQPNTLNRAIPAQIAGRNAPALNLTQGVKTPPSPAGAQLQTPARGPLQTPAGAQLQTPASAQLQSRGNQAVPSEILQGTTKNINPENLSKEQLAKVRETALSNDTIRGRNVPTENTDTKKADPAHLARAVKLGNVNTQSSSRPAPPLAGGLAQGTLAAQATGKQPLESLIAAGIKQILEPPMKHTNPHAQARVAATLLNQEGFSRLIATLLSDTESSLARLQLTQLASQGTESEQKQVWLIELPIRKEAGVDIFHMRIEKDTGNKNEEGQGDENFWSIKIAFDLQGLGPLYAKIAVLGNENVSTTLWAEHEQTVALFNRHISDLQGNLEKAGLCIDKLSCLHGKPADDEPAQTNQIVDEKA